VRELPPGLRDMRLDRTRGATCRSRIPSIGRRRSGQSGVALTSTTKSMQPASGLSSHLGRRSPDNGRQVRRPDRARTRGDQDRIKDLGNQRNVSRFAYVTDYSCSPELSFAELPIADPTSTPTARTASGPQPWTSVRVDCWRGCTLYRAPPKQRPTSCPNRLAPAYTL